MSAQMRNARRGFRLALFNRLLRKPGWRAVRCVAGGFWQKIFQARSPKTPIALTFHRGLKNSEMVHGLIASRAGAYDKNRALHWQISRKRIINLNY